MAFNLKSCMEPSVQRLPKSDFQVLGTENREDLLLPFICFIHVVSHLESALAEKGKI